MQPFVRRSWLVVHRSSHRPLLTRSASRGAERRAHACSRRAQGLCHLRPLCRSQAASCRRQSCTFTCRPTWASRRGAPRRRLPPPLPATVCLARGIQHPLPPTPCLSCQVQLRVDRLLGCLPAYREVDAAAGDGGVPPSALCVEGRLCSYGEPLGIPARTVWAEAGTAGAAWDTWLAFPIKYRDLGHDAQLALTVWEARDGEARRALGGTTLRLFSKKGRLKTGPQELQVWLGRAADGGWPSTTPAKVPVAQRGELG